MTKTNSEVSDIAVERALRLWNINLCHRKGTCYIMERPDSSGKRPFLEREPELHLLLPTQGGLEGE